MALGRKHIMACLMRDNPRAIVTRAVAKRAEAGLAMSVQTDSGGYTKGPTRNRTSETVHQTRL
eukprot:10369956-Lingulodinium_polyedra.AAC.1